MSMLESPIYFMAANDIGNAIEIRFQKLSLNRPFTGTDSSEIGISCEILYLSSRRREHRRKGNKSISDNVSKNNSCDSTAAIVKV